MYHNCIVDDQLCDFQTRDHNAVDVFMLSFFQSNYLSHSDRAVLLSSVLDQSHQAVQSKYLVLHLWIKFPQLHL